MPKSQVVRTLAAILLLAGIASSTAYPQTQEQASKEPAGPTIQYRNSHYGFCVSLPASWKGYLIVVDHWEGSNTSGPQGYQIVEHGPLISIRHPLWSKENPRQDIPIMVFTRKQWDSLQKDDFHIGAAPIGPNELGRNHKYVLALPARYNFANLPGLEEVDQIVQSKSLRAPCGKSSN